MSKKDRNVLLNDILESISKIRKYTNGYDLVMFLDDDKTRDAVVRNF
jgi:uncharacterized protein with HEPN domain